MRVCFYVTLDEEDGTFTGRIQFDSDRMVRTNFSATVIEIKPGRTSLNSIKEVSFFFFVFDQASLNNVN